MASFTCPICNLRQSTKTPIVCEKCGWPERMSKLLGGSVVEDQAPRNGNKYNAMVTERYGITFRSKGEADRYDQLRLRELAKEITHLEYEPESYPLVVNGLQITSYRPDFRYVEDGVQVVEDFKSCATARARDWPIRKKLMLAIYGIAVREWPLKTSANRRKRTK